MKPALPPCFILKGALPPIPHRENKKYRKDFMRDFLLYVFGRQVLPQEV
jgi:hypothetical protein